MKTTSGLGGASAPEVKKRKVRKLFYVLYVLEMEDNHGQKTGKWYPGLKEAIMVEVEHIFFSFSVS